MTASRYPEGTGRSKWPAFHGPLPVCGSYRRLAMNLSVSPHESMMWLPGTKKPTAPSPPQRTIGSAVGHGPDGQAFACASRKAKSVGMTPCSRSTNPKGSRPLPNRIHKNRSSTMGENCCDKSGLPSRPTKRSALGRLKAQATSGTTYANRCFARLTFLV